MLFALSLHSQSIDISFSSMFGCDYAQLDSVYIENLTQSGDTTIYWNDTVLTIVFTGIENDLFNSDGFSISQNYPNPFENRTDFDIYLPEKEDLSIYVYDLTGRLVADYSGSHHRGVNSFSFYSGQSNTYILTVISDQNIKYIKMLQLGKNGVSPRIEYKQTRDKNVVESLTTKSKDAKSNFLFNPGDEIRFTIYVSGESATSTDTPFADEDYVLHVYQSAPPAPVAVTNDVTTTGITWNWEGHHSALGYKICTTSDFFNAVDIGNVEYYIQEDLFCGTDYTLYVWAYNDCGNSAIVTFEESTAPCEEFTCGGTLYDTRDAKSYSTVLIGEQCWMAENLKYLPYVSGPGSTSTTYPYYYVHAYDGFYEDVAMLEESYQTTGVLYNWTAAMNEASSSSLNPSGVQGSCPEGWHLPSNLEWDQLKQHLSFNSEYWCNSDSLNIAKTLASTSVWSNDPTVCNVGNDQASNNTSGFNAYPSGFLSYSFGFSSNTNENATFWSTSIDLIYPFIYKLDYQSSEFIQDNEHKSDAYSIRCVKNGLEHASLEIITTEMSDITQTSAVSGGQITNSGGTVTSKGLVWSTYQVPTVDLNLGMTDEGSGNDNFTSTATGLETGTTYYIRAYAINADGTAYGNQIIFETQPEGSVGTPCPGLETIDYEGYTYETILIGDRCWLKENLRYLPEVSGPSEGSLTEPYYYVLDYDGTNVTDAKATIEYQTYGVLYNFAAAATACPDGWYIPTNDEWTDMERTLCISADCETEFQYGTSTNGWRGTNEGSKIAGNSTLWGAGELTANSEFGSSGFNALPGGYRYYNTGTFPDYDVWGQWWAFTNIEPVSTFASSRYLCQTNTESGRGGTHKDNGNSVRCIKATDIATLPSVETNEIVLFDANRVVIEGNVSDDGGASVFSRGFVINTIGSPTIDANDYLKLQDFGEGVFLSAISGLEQDQEYYIRAFATNAVGTSYGTEMIFHTHNYPHCGIINDSRDNKTYSTYQIGDQCWMAENLRYLPLVSEASSGSSTNPKYYVPLYNSFLVGEAERTDNYKIYGVLYNYPAASTACPEGWKLATHDEWTDLERAICNSPDCETEFPYNTTTAYTGTNEGSILAGISSLWVEDALTLDPDFNTSGFFALPAGRRYIFISSGMFAALGEYAYWWMEPSTGTSKWYRRLSNTRTDIYRKSTTSEVENGLSVRCLRDNTLAASVPEFDYAEVIQQTSSDAELKSYILNDGGSNITEKGFVWSSSPNPTTATNEGMSSDGIGAGNFYSTLSGLSSSTTYYVRAYATNNEGTSYSTEISFETNP